MESESSESQARLLDQTLRGSPVEMVEPEIVRQIRALSEMRWGTRRIAGELGVSRGTVKRYLRGGDAAEVQTRPQARRLTDEQRMEAVRLFETTAEGNAVVVQQLLAECGVDVHLRTVQRVVEPVREQRRAAEVATVRFETAPGHQLQIDFAARREATSHPVLARRGWDVRPEQSGFRLVAVRRTHFDIQVT